MSGSDIPVLVYSSLAGAATLLGIYLMERRQNWALKNSHYVNSFAAGLILAVAFFHLIPEANDLAENGNAFVAVFFGFLIFYILENIVILHSGAEIHYCAEDSDSHSAHTNRLGIMAFSGLAFHSLVDGIIIGVGFEVSAEVGLLAAMAVILHEVPEGVTSFAIMRESMTTQKARILSIIVAIATPLGAIGSLIFIGGLNTSMIGIVLGLAAGTFIYVSAADLIPETHESNNTKNLITFGLGSGFIYLITFLFAE